MVTIHHLSVNLFVFPFTTTILEIGLKSRNIVERVFVSDSMKSMVQRNGYRRVNVKSMLKNTRLGLGVQKEKKTVNFLLTISPRFPPFNRRTGWNSTVVYACWFPSTQNTCVYTNEKATHSMVIVFYTYMSSRRRFYIYLTTARQTVRGRPPGR